MNEALFTNSYGHWDQHEEFFNCSLFRIATFKLHYDLDDLISYTQYLELRATQDLSFGLALFKCHDNQRGKPNKSISVVEFNAMMLYWLNILPNTNKLPYSIEDRNEDFRNTYKPNYKGRMFPLDLAKTYSKLMKTYYFDKI